MIIVSCITFVLFIICCANVYAYRKLDKDVLCAGQLIECGFMWLAFVIAIGMIK